MKEPKKLVLMYDATKTHLELPDIIWLTDPGLSAMVFGGLLSGVENSLFHPCSANGDESGDEGDQAREAETTPTTERGVPHQYQFTSRFKHSEEVLNRIGEDMDFHSLVDALAGLSDAWIRSIYELAILVHDEPDDEVSNGYLNAVRGWVIPWLTLTGRLEDIKDHVDDVVGEFSREQRAARYKARRVS